MVFSCVHRVLDTSTQLREWSWDTELARKRKGLYVRDRFSSPERSHKLLLKNRPQCSHPVACNASNSSSMGSDAPFVASRALHLGASSNTMKNKIKYPYKGGGLNWKLCGLSKEGEFSSPAFRINRGLHNFSLIIRYQKHPTLILGSWKLSNSWAQTGGKANKFCESGRPVSPSPSPKW